MELAWRPQTEVRAQRFPLELPVRYRRVGETVWLDGKTENISHSGVLFRVEQPFDVDTPVEIRITLPATTSGSTGSEVLCQARIVRAEVRPDPTVALAAAFSREQLVPVQIYQ